MPVTDVVVTRDGGYLLDVEDRQLDWARFARDVEEGTRLLTAGLAEQARQPLDRALASWRGPPFVDIPGSPRRRELAAWLEQSRLVALEDVGEAMILTGDDERLVPRLAALVVEHPLEERFWEQLVRALLGCGRRAEALMAYRRAADTLRAEIGVEPGPRLRGAHALALYGAAASWDPPGEDARPLPTDRRDPGLERRRADRRGRGQLTL